MARSMETAFQLTSYHIGMYTYSKEPKFFLYPVGGTKIGMIWLCGLGFCVIAPYECNGLRSEVSNLLLMN